MAWTVGALLQCWGLVDYCSRLHLLFPKALGPLVLLWRLSLSHCAPTALQGELRGASREQE